jgi:transposase
MNQVKTMAKTRNFSPEFRLEAAQLVVDQGYTVKAACDAMGVGKSTMEYWVRKLRSERAGKAPRGEALTTEQREIQELKRRLRRADEEKEILKKATVDSTDQCNIMHTGNYRGFQNAAASIKDQRADLPAEAGAMGSMEERAVA